MTFEDKTKTTYKEVTENSDASSKKSESQSKKFDAIYVRLHMVWP